MGHWSSKFQTQHSITGVHISVLPTPYLSYSNKCWQVGKADSHIPVFIGHSFLMSICRRCVYCGWRDKPAAGNCYWTGPGWSRLFLQVWIIWIGICWWSRICCRIGPHRCGSMLLGLWNFSSHLPITLTLWLTSMRSVFLY